jgi:large subunit ribosomal protein L13
MKTYSIKLADIKRDVHTIDASNQVLGRLATKIATLLMGKHKTLFSRNLDTGDFVTVINANKIKVTGKKVEQMTYNRHSGYPGGFKSVPYEKMLELHPDRIIEFAVKGMLPQNRLRAKMLKRLRIYSGEIPLQIKNKAVEKAPTTAEEKEDN